MNFPRNLAMHILSGVGILAVRTRDSMSTALAVSAFCTAQNRPALFWDAARGFVRNEDPVEGTGNGNRNFVATLQGLMQPESPDYPANGVFTYSMMHHTVTSQRPNPEALSLMTILAHSLSSGQRRMVLAVPTSYVLPPELRELIPVIDHLPPATEDLEVCVDNVMMDYQERSKRYLPKLTDDTRRRIAQAGAGMIAPEFESALARVLVPTLFDKRALTADEVRTGLLDEKAQMVKRHSALEVMSAIEPSSVGGLGKLKRWIETRRAAMDPEAWEAGVDKPKGVALVGPPGTGKSLVAKVVGSVLGVATIRFDISAVFSGLVGSSEANMREALFMIESLAPCVVMLDEIDKIVSTGPGGDSGVGQKVLGSLLTFMQENDKAIFWVPTLNRTENVPAEFLRAGRLDDVFGVNVPNPKERLEILQIHLRKRKAFDEAMDLTSVVSATDRFVGAEIEQVVSAAKLNAYNDQVDLSVDHLLTAAQETRPLSRKMEEQFKAMESWCAANAAPANDANDTPLPRGRSRRRLEAVADVGDTLSTPVRRGKKGLH